MKERNVKKKEEEDIFMEMEKRVKWRGKEMPRVGHVLQILSFDCKNHCRLADIC